LHIITYIGIIEKHKNLHHNFYIVGKRYTYSLLHFESQKHTDLYFFFVAKSRVK